MSRSIPAKFGVLEDRIVHVSTDEELQMIKSHIKDISTLRNESKDSSLFGWAMAFLGAAFSSLLTLIALSSDSKYFNLICCLIFITTCLGIYFYWNWATNKKKETSALQLKEKELDKLFQKIEKRIHNDSEPINEYDNIFSEEKLKLKKL